MNQEIFRRSHPHLLLKRVGLGWLTAYVLVAAGLGTVLYKFWLTPMFLVPLIAELVLVKSRWTVSSYWMGVTARFAGLAVANALIYFFYVIPVIYEGKDPWSEEALWAYIILGGQTVVAAIALRFTRILLRMRSK